MIPETGQRFRCNVISTITNRVQVAFMVFREAFTNWVFFRFLRRLLRLHRQPIFLIVGRHPAHRSGRVQRWVAAQMGRLQLFFVPGHSPDLNPNEFLNHHVKTNALWRRRPHDRDEMVATVRAYLRNTQRQPEISRRYFRSPSVRYATVRECHL